MIYVEIEALKSEGRGSASGNGWHDTDDVDAAVVAELGRFHRLWDHLGHGAITTYKITVAPEASPRRTVAGDKPLPDSDQSSGSGEGS